MIFQNSNTAPGLAQGASEDITKISNVTSNSLNELLNTAADQLPFVIAGLLVLLLFWLIAKIVKAVFLYTSRKTKLDLRLRMLGSRLIGIAIIVVGIFTALTIMIPKFGFSDLVAGLGFSSFIVGFATKDILNNFLSGVLVLWQEPFKMGDYVFVNDHEGAVIEIGLRATRLGMYDGEQILIPNGQMYSSALMIREAGALQRVKIDIVIDYESTVSGAKEKILASLDELDGVVADPAPKVFLTDLATEGIRLTVYFWVDTDDNSVMDLYDSASTGINRTLRDAGVKLFPPKPFVMEEKPAHSGKRKDKEDF
jgi:small-conductance mechanosensitive channel